MLGALRLPVTTLWNVCAGRMLSSLAVSIVFEAATVTVFTMSIIMFIFLAGLCSVGSCSLCASFICVSGCYTKDRTGQKTMCDESVSVA